MPCGFKSGAGVFCGGAKSWVKVRRVSLIVVGGPAARIMSVVLVFVVLACCYCPGSFG